MIKLRTINARTISDLNALIELESELKNPDAELQGLNGDELNGDEQTRNDGIGTYLKDLRSYSLLTREQEISIARDIDKYRREYKRLILETPFGLEAAINILYNTHHKRIALDQILYCPRKKDDKKRLKLKLSDTMHQIDEILGRQTDCQTVSSPNSSRKKETKIYELSAEERNKLQHLVEELPLQTRLFTGFIDLLETFKGIEAILEERKKCPTDLLCEPRRNYNKRLEQIKETRILYENAKKKMAEGNIRLVVSIAGKYKNKGVNLIDLIGDGNVGLMKAAERYNVEKGYKFSTYATWWIKRTIKSALDQKGIIKTPYNKVLKKTIAELASKKGRIPTIKEISDELGISAEDINKILKATYYLSIDKNVGTDMDDTYGNLMEDEQTPRPEEDASQILLRNRITSMLEGLEQREKEIIELRYGIFDGYTLTLQEVGKIFGVTRERIRKIQSEALEKLRTDV